MSDEFEFPDEDEEGSDNDGVEDDGDNDDDDLNDGDSENQTPQSIYTSAKDNIGLADDLETIELFMQVFEQAEDSNLKSKAIGHALIIMAQMDDVDTVIQTLDKYIDMANSNKVKPKRFEKTLNEVLNRSWHSEAVYTAVLNDCINKVDKNDYMELFLDLQFRQLEFQLNAGLQPEAEKIAKELEENIPLTPDPNDTVMTKFASRLLTTNMDLALARGDEMGAIHFYSLISALPQSDVPSLRVSGVLKQTQGLEQLHEGHYQSAKNLLREAFTDFNNSGNDKRLTVLPYYTIAFMLCKERSVDPYRAQELLVLQNHPLVAPMRQLFDAYINNDYVKYQEKLPSAKESFNSEFYSSKLDDIGYDVLSHCIIKFTKPYSAVKINYIANQLKCNENDVRKAIFQLIYKEDKIEGEKEKFGMVIDEINDILVKKKNVEIDNLLSPFTKVLDVLDNVANQYLDKHKITVNK